MGEVRRPPERSNSVKGLEKISHGLECIALKHS
jgi:hypothetical protein